MISFFSFLLGERVSHFAVFGLSRSTLSALGLSILLLPGLLNAQTSVELKQNFRDAEIASVIEAVAKVTGKNFIIDPRVRGKVTLIAPEPMSAQALYQTLLAILNVHGFVAVPSGEVIKIVPANLARDQLPYSQAQDRGEAWVTEVVRVAHVDAAKLVAILRPLVAREGHLVSAESGHLIVTDTVDGIKRIKAILRQVDVRSDGEYEVIQLRNAPADELVKTLKSILPTNAGASGARISFDERTNRIILAGEAASRLAVRALIAELDVALPQDGRVQVIYLRYGKAADLVPILEKIATNRSLLQSTQAQASPALEAAAKVPDLQDKQLDERISIVADERMNALIISAPPNVLTGLKAVIKQLDIRRAQVLIEAILVELTQSKQAELGVDWAVNGANGVGVISLSGALSGLAGNVGNTAKQVESLGKGFITGFGEVNAKNQGWAALVKALSGDSSANILSTPTLLTLDNEEAEIIVGREVPFQTGSYATSANSSNNPFTTIERKSVGLKLRVKPQINEGDEIQLVIEQEISDVLPKSDAVDLETSKRQIKTTVIVGDGNMVVLGGLLSEKETEVANKVPFLGDIPGLGAMFRYQDSQREKVNLMVFLRPIIVRDNLMSDYYSRKKYNQVRAEQAQILEEESLLLDGLRPQMPRYEQWQVTPPSGAAVDEMAHTPTAQTAPSTAQSTAQSRRDSSLDVLGF
ncbi:MAG: type II secretion system secretin GspD [Thiomicrospira sp.]